MGSINKQACPTCGQSINEHEIPVNSSLVQTLLNVYKFCIEKQRHEFKRDDIDHLIPKGHAYGNFGYWKWFGAGLVYSPEGRGKGYWGFNLERIAEFFAGKRQIYGTVWKNPLKPEGEQFRFGKMIYIQEVPSIREFIDENREFIVRYAGEAPSTQGLPVKSPRKKRLKKGQFPCPKCGEALVRKNETLPSDQPNTLGLKEWFECPECGYNDKQI